MVPHVKLQAEFQHCERKQNSEILKTAQLDEKNSSGM